MISCPISIRPAEDNSLPDISGLALSLQWIKIVQQKCTQWLSLNLSRFLKISEFGCARCCVCARTSSIHGSQEICKNVNDFEQMLSSGKNRTYWASANKKNGWHKMAKHMHRWPLIIKLSNYWITSNSLKTRLPLYLQSRRSIKTLCYIIKILSFLLLFS